VFRTREDESGSTHVVFGDGLSGARLPTGSNNIVANYRYGAGAAVPEAGTLVSVLQAQPGLASLVNPVAPAGGTDADPPAKVRTLAPESVLTFGRAVSLDDYQTLAAGAPGVTAAQASYAFDPLAQRPTVHVWVAGDAGAAPSAQAAIATVADPNRTFKVEAATAIDFWLSLTYVRDPRYLDADVQQGIHDALLDPDRGLFGSNRVRIGQAYFDSDIYAACLAVQGVVAVHQLSFVTAGLTLLTLPVLRLTGRRLEELALQRRIPTIARDQPLKLVARPPIDLLPIPINISSASRPCNLERYSPGDGNYFALLDDGEHLTITGEVSS
jgi:predicted phage baseplate assembly protein